MSPSIESRFDHKTTTLATPLRLGQEISKGKNTHSQTGSKKRHVVVFSTRFTG